MRVQIIQTGEPLWGDGDAFRKMRAMALADFLVENGIEVDVVSSNFSHQKKTHRFSNPTSLQLNKLLTLHLIDSPGYSRNIGIARMLDHLVLAWKGFFCLRKLPKPDIAFVGFPPIELAFLTILFSRSRGVKTILDVKDQWPSLFLDKVPRSLKAPAMLLLSPLFFLSRWSMKSATVVKGPTSGYVDWIYAFSGRTKADFDGVLPLLSPRLKLTTRQKEISQNWTKTIINPSKDIIRILFFGSHMSVFDFKTLADALIIASEEDKPSIEVLICGSGDYESVYKNDLSQVDGVKFLGWQSFANISALAKFCHMAIAPYQDIKNFSSHVPNKIIDYFSLGLPVLTPLSGTTRHLITDNDMGIFYRAENSSDLADAILKLACHEKLRLEMAKNCKQFHADHFNFEIVFSDFVKELQIIGSL